MPKFDTNSEEDKRSRMQKIIPNIILRWSIYGLMALILLFFFSPIVFIQSHERGLRFTMGKISNTILESGVQFKLPFFQTIETIPIRPQQMDWSIEVGPDGAITKDNQTMGALGSVFFVYNESELPHMWKDYGIDKIRQLVSTGVKESFKSSVGQNTIFDISVNQEIIRNKTIEIVKTKLANYPIKVTELRVTNYDWNDDFDKQIQETMKKAQQVKQKEQELKMTEIDAQKKVKIAEADKQAKIENATGDKESIRLLAEAKVLEGIGLQKYNESIRATQDIEIKLRQLAIEMDRVKKWNGQYVPNNNYGPIPVQTGVVQGK